MNPVFQSNIQAHFNATKGAIVLISGDSPNVPFEALVGEGAWSQTAKAERRKEFLCNRQLEKIALYSVCDHVYRTNFDLSES